MTGPAEGGRRRVRRRGAAPKPAPPPAHPDPEPSGEPGPAPAATNRAGSESTRPDKAERSLRGLVGAGPTQVPVSAAMRARDAARPTDEDLAAAERDLTIVRRHYRPQDPASSPPGDAGRGGSEEAAGNRRRSSGRKRRR